MQNKSVFKIFLFVLLVSFVVFSCKKNDDPEPDQGTTYNYTGLWRCVEISKINGTTTYSITISKGTVDTTQLMFQNFYLLGNSVKATAISSGTNFTFLQQVLAGNQLTSGGGTYMGNTINMDYVMNTGSVVDSCTATLTRQ